MLDARVICCRFPKHFSLLASLPVRITRNMPWISIIYCWNRDSSRIFRFHISPTNLFWLRSFKTWNGWRRVFFSHAFFVCTGKRNRKEGSCCCCLLIGPTNRVWASLLLCCCLASSSSHFYALLRIDQGSDYAGFLLLPPVNKIS